MIELLQAIWDEIIVRLWNYGTRSARLVIRVAILGIVFLVVIPLLVWPFVLLAVSFVDSNLGTWFTAGAALVPLAALVIFVIASTTILIVAYPLLSGVLLAIPRVRSLLMWLVVAVAVAVFGELAIGFYLVWVPVWNHPWLILALALTTTLLAMFLILKRQLGWRGGAWFSSMLVLVIIGVTIAFFFSGRGGIREWKEERERRRAEQIVAAQAERAPEEFILNAGEEIFTVRVGPGTQHRIRANKPWVALSRDDERGTYRRPDGNYRPENKGLSSVWNGGAPRAPLLVRGVEDGTTLRFEKVR